MVRIFLTGWILFSAHFSSNVVRESYLAITLAERLSVRVDEYDGLHPDLFRIPGRGVYINSNPGASIFGAIPYAVARPFLAVLYRLRPDLLEPKAPAAFDDPRPNRVWFMNEARARGLDVKLGLAAAVMQVGLMAPASALAMVLMYVYLCGWLRDEKQATLLALLYGFGTPVFFRTAFLNQNLILAHLVLVAFAALTWPGRDRDPGDSRRHLLAGACLGTGVLCDYSAVPLAVTFAAWVLATRGADDGLAGASRAGLQLALGAAGPILLLLGYQWAAFGSPWFPAQRYMPPTQFSVQGWNGMTWPTGRLLRENLLSPAYGLLLFCPMLVGAAAAPFFRSRPSALRGREAVLILVATIALWLFNSANQFAALQFNTGVRYMVPVVPLLFVALVPVLLYAPRVVAWLLVCPTLVVSWSVSMVREGVPESLARVFSRGPELPWVTVLRRMGDGPSLTVLVSPVPILMALALVVWLIWRRRTAAEPLGPTGPLASS